MPPGPGAPHRARTRPPDGPSLVGLEQTEVGPPDVDLVTQGDQPKDRLTLGRGDGGQRQDRLGTQLLATGLPCGGQPGAFGRGSDKHRLVHRVDELGLKNPAVLA